MHSTHTAATRRLDALGAFRYRDFQLYWVGSLVAITGQQVRIIAQPWLVFHLTGSPLQLGITGTLTGLAPILLAPFAGAVADRVDRRRLLILTQLCAGLLVLGLAVITSAGLVEVWHVYAFAFANGVVLAFDNPARQAIVPNLIASRDDLPSAVVLSSAIWQGSRIVGPSLAGLLIALFGVATCFYVTALGFLIMVAAISRIQLTSESDGRAPSGNVMQDMTQGLGFIAGDTVLRSLIGLSFYVGLFGISYISLLAAFAEDVHGVGATGLGLLGSASGAGAILGTVTVALAGITPRRGPLLLAGAAAFGASLALFAVAPWFPLALAMIAVSGFVSSFYLVSTNTVLQLRLPDHMRGRVMSIFGLTWNIPQLGALPVGAFAEAAGAPAAVAINGIIVTAVANAPAALVPQLRRI